MDKEIEESINKKISLLTTVLLASVLCAMVGMLLILSRTSKRTEMINRLESERSYCDEAINEFQKASQSMTSEIWQYAISGNPVHLEGYWNEVENEQLRDKAIQKLMHSGLTRQELSHALRAKSYSDTLIQGEIWGMRMIAEGNGAKETDLPPRVAAFHLNKDDAALSALAKIGKARNYLFGIAYTTGRRLIDDTVQNFHSDLLRRMETTSTQAITAGREANIYAAVAVSALTVLMLVIILLFSIVIKRKNLQLVAALEKAQAASSAKSYFTSRMSHEIRTPLNAVLGYLGIARKTNDADKRADSLHKIGIAAENLLHIVNDVLDLSVIESGRMKLASDTFSLSKLIDDLKVVYSNQAETKGIALETMVEGNNGNLIGDRMRTNQILTNLLSNAVKFTQSGTIVLKAVQKTITEKDKQKAQVTFTVKDTGTGISADFLPHIFEPYEQENASISPKYGGTGLGLSIVKSMAQLMGGRATVSSEKGKGTEFTVVLPFIVIPEESTAQKVKQDQPTDLGEHCLTGMRLLLAEDNEMNSEIARIILTEAGAVVTPVYDGQEAAEDFERSSPGQYDAILMDIMMPKLNGYEATKRIRTGSHPNAKTVPIVAMTANAFESDVKLAIESGMNAHIAKPIDVPKMLRTLSSLKHQN